MTNTKTMTIRGRTFTVSPGTSPTMPWTLTGVRGAVYGTLRNVHSGLLVPFGSGKHFKATGMDGVRLSDSDGVLRVVAS